MAIEQYISGGTGIFGHAPPYVIVGLYGVPFAWKCPMLRAVFYAVVVGGTYSLCLLVVLNNVPLAAGAGILVGCLALLRGRALWG